MANRVGIVMVSYNASLAVRTTLASLRAARNETPSELLLVDNASREEERVRIQNAVDRHVREAGLPWRYLQEPTNLGFSGGNNVGIRRLLEDPSITHVCLLNSDVVVPDEWLDRLLEPGLDVVSAVTNKADSEQCVPIDYSLSLDDCLDAERETLRDAAFAAVDGFARRWRQAWRGNVVDCDPTFFCVLISRAALTTIGLLDETFFPGGFEDDDYCIRARTHGLSTYVARDVFIHHWGSASFGQLNYDYFNEHALRNRRHLEQKHGLVWLRRPEKPFVSFALDVTHALSKATAAGDDVRALRRRFFDLYVDRLGRLLTVYCSEFRSFERALHGCGCDPSAELAPMLAAARRHEDLERRWLALTAELAAEMARQTPPVADSRLGERLQEFTAGVHAVATCNVAAHAFLSEVAPATVGAQLGRPLSFWRRAFSLLRHGLPFFLRLRGIMFFGGYPYAQRERDGYFQRIRVVDGVFDDRWRIYFDPQPLPGQSSWYDVPAARTLVLRPVGGRLRKLMVKATVWVLAVRCRTIYFHSVLRMEDLHFGRMMRWPWFKKVLDVHGVVPEEFRMHNDFYSAVRFDAHERLAVRRAHCVVVVTEAMRRYFVQKYRDALRGETIVLPIFPAMVAADDERPYVDGLPLVVYAGGLQKWQQVPAMIDAIVRTRTWCRHRFYCPEPDQVTAMLPIDVVLDGSVVVASKTHDELVACYRECHFGLLLRQDIVVNHVACPTKLIEYLAMGIVPILDCAEVGDFTALGMQHVSLADFLAGKLPDAERRQQMVEANLAVHAALRAQREAGVARLTQLVGGRRAVKAKNPDSLIDRALWQAAKLFPERTARGRLARRTWRALHGGSAVPAAPAAPAEPATPAVQPCDVLVQVGNFGSGGLENVTLNLNEALQSAGFTVSMLVLGQAGEGVERARKQGIAVCTASYSSDAYRRWLLAAKPKVVISHYSADGAEVCGELGVPLVQVIHNVYIWLDAAQRAELQRSAGPTTVFVAVSEFAQNYSVRRLGLPHEKCIVIPNGVDVQRFHDLDVAAERTRLRKELGIGADEFVFLGVGSINHQKNFPSLLRSFEQCRHRCPAARLLVIGPPQEPAVFAECRDFVASHGLEAQVILAGAVPDPHRYYAMADAFAHSAFFEGGQLVMLEALAADLPIASVETGLAMHFKGRRGVHLVQPHFDVASFDGHITKMPCSPETERQLAEAMVAVYRSPERPGLPADVVAAFDRSITYHAYIELVRDLIAGRRFGAPSTNRTWPEKLANAV